MPEIQTLPLLRQASGNNKHGRRRRGADATRTKASPVLHAHLVSARACENHERTAKRHPSRQWNGVRRSRRAVFIRPVLVGPRQLHHAFNDNTRSPLFTAIAGEKISLVGEFRKRLTKLLKSSSRLRGNDDRTVRRVPIHAPCRRAEEPGRSTDPKKAGVSTGFCTRVQCAAIAYRASSRMVSRLAR